MNDLQKKLIEMMKWIDDVCQTNKICYYMIGGTMLGAVRHHGFIPWDDDMDIGMPRNDYEKFYDIVMAMNDDRYCIESIKEMGDCLSGPFMRIYDKSTTLVFNLEKKPVRGLFIDIFPIDGIGNTREESYKNFRKINLMKNIIWAYFAPPKKRVWYKKIVVEMSQKILYKILNVNRLLKKTNDLCSERKYEDCEYVANLLGIYGEKEIIPKAVFGTPKEYDFENYKFMGVENYDAYLKGLYGDYMVLPPKDKQKSEHGFLFLDLNKPYLE